MRAILTLVVVMVVSGCTSPSLVRQMERQGITYQNTSRIVLSGSEGDFGSSTKVDIEEQFIIQEIWDSIYQSRPYSVWCACGYRRADFYAGSDGDPVVTLWINASDACHLTSREPIRFRCPQLNELVMKILQAEYEKQQKAGQPSGPTP